MTDEAGNAADHPAQKPPDDLNAWRKAERVRLRSRRMALSVAERQAAGGAIGVHLRELLLARFDGASGLVFSGYWPIKGEPDLRPLMTELHDAGVAIALPIVEAKAAPLVFRRWTPQTRMIRGDWNIPVPPPDASRITPDITLAPVLGWTRNGYRLGYGGGYFDRTLASLEVRPFTIGIGFDFAEMPTIHPQPHDIPLEVILTENGMKGIMQT